MTWSELKVEAERRMRTASPEMMAAYAAMASAVVERERRESEV